MSYRILGLISYKSWNMGKIYTTGSISNQFIELHFKIALLPIFNNFDIDMVGYNYLYMFVCAADFNIFSALKFVGYLNEIYILESDLFVVEELGN